MKNQGQFLTYGYKNINEIYLDQYNNILKTNFGVYVEHDILDDYIYYKFNHIYLNKHDLRKILNETFG